MGLEIVTHAAAAAGVTRNGSRAGQSKGSIFSGCLYLHAAGVRCAALAAERIEDRIADQIPAPHFQLQLVPIAN